jgi:hypothetical protein
MAEPTRLTFRIAPWRPWLLALTPFAVLAAVGVSSGIASGAPAVAVTILLGFAVVAVALLGAIALAVRVSRWQVDPGGIGGRNNSLVYRRLDWSDIGSVEPWKVPGYRYVQVKDIGGRRAFWMPMFRTYPPGLHAAVTRYAPPDNPLRRYLDRNPA